MIVLKKFSSEQMLQDYLTLNINYKIVDTVGVGSTVVVLTDEFNITNSQNVYEYINSNHYEDINIHYKAYYDEY